MKSKKLDFIVIGAAKSGTTTLFEILKDHPNICMPKEKEVPYFLEPELYNKGYDWYFNKFFSSYQTGQICGTITPQYMLGYGDISPKDIAHRIKSHNKNVKVIAILREPIERAYSHYQMFSQRGRFVEDFNTHTSKLLSEDLSSFYEEGIEDSNSYVTGSQYGRILEYYYNVLTNNQIKLLYMDNLQSNPKEVIGEILKFIGLDSKFESNKFGKTYRKGNSKPKTKILTPGYIFKIPGLELFWKKVIPYRFRKPVEYRINLWNIKSTNIKNDNIDIDIKKALLELYKADTFLLEKISDNKAPWSVYYEK